VLQRRKSQVSEERSARQAPLSDGEVAELLAAVDTVLLARGRKVERRPAAEIRPADLKGPTGNYRAPLLKRGRLLLVGFHAESLEALA